MSKELNYKKVKEVISGQALTAEQIAEKLGIQLTQDNRKIILSKVRRAAREVVKRFNGKKVRDDEGVITYFVEE